MKRLILSIILVVSAMGLFAQNTDGTGTGWEPNRRKQSFKDSVYFNVSPVFKAGQFIDLDDYAVMDQPDTLHVTASDTLDATFNGVDVFNYAAASIRISLPQNITGMPIGTTVNFFQMAAGKFVFNAQAGVTIVSPLDSIATKQKGDVVGLKKIAANKYMLYGNLTD